jgi:hypothetical protein
MPAAIVARSDRSFTLQVEVPYADSMLDCEDHIQAALNDAGVTATAEALTRFDTDGSPIQLGDTKLTSKGTALKEYQTPYGVARIQRHVYQGSHGGPTFCPLDRDARIVVSSTPKFARMIAYKYAEFGAARVTLDLAANHGRTVARSFVQHVADAVAAAALVKEESWSYAPPELDQRVATVTVGLDGTCLYLGPDGWREAMVGTLGFYDRHGERLHTIYIAATPEYGRGTFLDRLEREIAQAKGLYPAATYVGLADGANGIWDFLAEHTDGQVVDFWHAAEHLGKAAAVFFRGQERAGADWMEQRCHRLKHEPGAAAALAQELRRLAQERPWAKADADVAAAVSYFANQSRAGRMDYAGYVAESIPIGSGVTEAACKVIVKQRLCGSGMRWKEQGAAAVLSLRCLVYTTGRWEEFWGKVDRYGFPVAA